MGFVKVLALDELHPGEMTRVEVDGLLIALARVEDEVFAFSDTCSHMQESLSEGILDEHCVYCPLHQSGFDIRTGEAMSPPAIDPIQTYETNIQDGAVWIKTSG